MSAPLAECRGFAWTPDGAREPTLRGIDLAIGPGERVLLAGPSGSGKSTLLRALAGVLHVGAGGQSEGQVLLRGRPAPEAAASVGLLVQDPRDARVAHSVGRDVAFGCENVGMPRAQIPAAVQAALHAVRFPYGPEHAGDAVSGGEAQRLALAGVIAPRPDLLLLDEPTSMLDPVAAAAVHEAVAAAIAGSDIALVVVEHRLRDWLPLLHRMVVLDATGRIVADGPIEHTLAAQGDSLARAGVWVPQYPDPEPLVVPPELLTPIAGVVGAGLCRAGAAGGRAAQARTGRVGAGLAGPGHVGVGSSGAGRTGSSQAGAGPADAAAPRLDGVLLRTWDLRLELAAPLRFTGVRHRRPPPTRALDGVDAAVWGGRLLALRGGSGAGKSSLVAALCGLLAPTAGRVHAAESLAGGLPDAPHRWRSRDLAARVGWVPQEAAANVVGATVRDCLLATARALGGGAEHSGAGGGPGSQERDTARLTDDADERAQRLADLLGLGALLHRNPYRLSGGEARRLALAAGMLHGPPLVCLDEPTVGQDRHTWAAVAGLVLAARDGGAGVVVSTHDDSLAELAQDRLELRGGQVVR